MDILPVTQNNLAAALRLLTDNHLPTEDITKATHLFVLTYGNETAGTVAVELCGKYGLLRSLCVADSQRNAGAGQRLITFIEDYAKQKGVKVLYLLTTTADSYFKKKTYAVIDRNDTPAAIKSTSEFASVCPSTAVVMKKELS